MGFVGNYLRNLPAVCLGRQPQRPLLFSYYVTHRCDLACRYCCDGDGKRFKENAIAELDTAQACRLISLLRPACDTLDITGGEPMVRPDLEELLAHAKGLGFRTVLNTKGLGLEKRLDLLRHTDVLVLSLDTLDPAALALLIGRPRATAEAIITALHAALAERKRTGTRVVLSVVATPDNLHEVPKVLAFAAEHGLGFHLSPEIVGTKVHPALVDNPQYRSLVDHTLERKRQGAGVLGVEQYLHGIRDFDRFRCHPLLMPVIRPDGRLYYPCLEFNRAEVDIVAAGGYLPALRAARQRFGELPQCPNCCHLFCHMALTLLQTHPLAALSELRQWGN